MRTMRATPARSMYASSAFGSSKQASVAATSLHPLRIASSTAGLIISHGWMWTWTSVTGPLTRQEPAGQS